jgi:hypothetical protein
MSSHERFHVVYDGPALTEHRMDVRDLAPALIAFADLFSAANKEINGNAAELRVQVNANFKAGSFGIDLLATQQLLSQIKDMFSGHGATAITNAYTIMTMIGFTGGGLVGLLRLLKGRRPIKIEQKQNAAIATICATETERIDIGPQVLKLYRSSEVRANLEKVMSPLQRVGITELDIVMNERVMLRIEDEEIGSFSASMLCPDTEIVSDTTSRKLLLIESLTFKDGNKWRVHDGTSTFHVVIEDKEFLATIDSGKQFGKGDVLVVDLRGVQTIIGAKLATDWTIVKVLEHRQPLQQTLL